MAWIGALIGAAGSLIGDSMSQSGQSGANQMNMDIAQMNNQFNSAQAQLNRDWETQMSNTAMQRRMADNKAAGVNPLLAVGQGGASSPMAGAASASGNPQMQNANTAFGNLGGFDLKKCGNICL